MSAAKYLRTVTISEGEVTYDSNMPIRVLRQMTNAEDLDGLVESLTGFVKEWPFEGDPTDEEAWDDLGRIEFNELIRAVMEDLGTAGE